MVSLLGERNTQNDQVGFLFPNSNHQELFPRDANEHLVEQSFVSHYIWEMLGKTIRLLYCRTCQNLSLAVRHCDSLRAGHGKLHFPNHKCTEPLSMAPLGHPLLVRQNGDCVGWPSSPPFSEFGWPLLPESLTWRSSPCHWIVSP